MSFRSSLHKHSLARVFSLSWRSEGLTWKRPGLIKDVATPAGTDQVPKDVAFYSRQLLGTVSSEHEQSLSRSLIMQIQKNHVALYRTTLSQLKSFFCFETGSQVAEADLELAK